MSLRRTIPAGLVDAAFSSLATLAIGLFAARRLPPDQLGAYAVFFSAFLFCAVIPAQLTFLPAEISTLRYPPADRMRQISQSLRLGSLVALPAAVTAIAAVLVVPPSVSSGVVQALAITTVACSFLSPIQDHVRRMLHLAGQSWKAASVSVAQFVIAVGAVFTLIRLHVPSGWIPLGSLSFANAGSLLFGLGLGRRRGAALFPLSVRRLVRSGGWLLVVGAAPPAAGFAVSALVARLAGSETLGWSEAARVVGQPLLVLALGLSAVLGPRSMEAAAHGRLPEARRIKRIFVWISALGTASYTLVVGFRWPGNPLAKLVPNAYVVGGLVVATAVGNLFNAIVFPGRSELLGGGRERGLAAGELAGSAAICGVGATAGVTHSFAKPLGFIGQGIVRLIAFRFSLRGVYDAPDSNVKETRMPLSPGDDLLIGGQ